MIQLDDDSIVTLTDDEGNDFDFLLLDVVEYQGGDYLVLLPLSEEEDEEDNVLILRAERTEEGETYQGVEDEDVLNAVFDLFNQQIEEAAKEAGLSDDEEEEEGADEE